MTTGYIDFPPDDDPPRTDRVEPDRELLKAARERAGLSQKAAARLLAARANASEGSLRVRIQHFENGRDHSFDAELHEVLCDAITERLRHPLSAADRTLVSMLSCDSLAAGIRADLRRTRYRIAQREEQIAQAEDHLARLRAGLDMMRDAERSGETSLAELAPVLDGWRDAAAATR